MPWSYCLPSVGQKMQLEIGVVYTKLLFDHIAGFDLQIEHPHAHVVQCAQAVRGKVVIIV